MRIRSASLLDCHTTMERKNSTKTWSQIALTVVPAPCSFTCIRPRRNQQPIGVLTFLPSRFLPAGQTKISVGGASVELDTSNLWEPVEKFLERMLNKTPEPHHRKESFGVATEVKHG